MCQHIPMGLACLLLLVPHRMPVYLLIYVISGIELSRMPGTCDNVVHGRGTCSHVT